jgi:hypothetical protein
VSSDNQGNISRNYRDYDVPYGKHDPLPYSSSIHSNHTTTDSILPIVLIRDPFRWMRKMCQVRYDASWNRSQPHRCPNLVRTITLSSSATNNKTSNSSTHTYTTYPVTVRISNRQNVTYPSLADWWATWNRAYYEQVSSSSMPCLMVRFEDLLFFAPQVLRAIRQCVGWTTSSATIAESSSTHPMMQLEVKERRHAYLLDASKDHGSSSDLVTALIRYGSRQGRHRGLARVDKEYAKSALDPELMRVFHYPQVPLL